MSTATAPMPTWDQVNDRLNDFVTEKGEWAGAPRLCDFPLVLEPRYPFQKLNGMTADITGTATTTAGDDDDDGALVVNSWWSEKRMATVYLWQDDTGRRRTCWIQDQGWPTRLKTLLDSFSPACVLSAKAEFRAMATLQEMVSDQQWRLYVINGGFIEHSPRSGVFYIFRKGHPTLAMTSRPHGQMRILAALCLHPIGYYEGTPMGAMVPTDDVIAHLLFMRGDERKFWSKANHHPPHLASSGV